MLIYFVYFWGSSMHYISSYLYVVLLLDKVVLWVCNVFKCINTIDEIQCKLTSWVTWKCIITTRPLVHFFITCLQFKAEKCSLKVAIWKISGSGNCRCIFGPHCFPEIQCPADSFGKPPLQHHMKAKREWYNYNTCYLLNKKWLL